MGFRPVTVPLLKGFDTSSADLSAIATSQELLTATNVVFTKTGAIKGRPGTVSKDAAYTAYDGSAGGGSIGTFGYTPAALHAAPTWNSVLLQGHGRAAVKGTNGWLDTGPVWSMRRQTCATLRTIPSLTTSGLQGVSFDVTPTTASVRVSDGTGLPGFPSLDSRGEIEGHWSPAPTHFTDNPGLATHCAVNNAVFWLGQAGDLGNLYCQINGTFPTTTQFTLATDAVAGAPDLAHVQRVWCAWDGTNYFVAYVTNASTVKISKVNTAGSVLASLTYASAGPADQSVALAVDSSSGKGLLVFTNNAAASIKTRVFTLSTMADSAINVDITPTFATAYGAIAGIAGGVGYIGYNGDVGSITHQSSVDLWTRSLTTNAAAVSITSFIGASMPLAPTVWHQYQTLFPFQVVAGRVLVGLQSFSSATVSGIGLGPTTWAVVDVTPPSVSGVGARQPVAAGQINGCCPVHRPGNACVLADGSLFFGVPEGITFTQKNVETCGLTAIKLTPQAAPSASVDNQLLLGGNVSYIFDGHQTLESNWVEKPVFTGVLGGAGGTLQAASYTFKAVWVATDATGRVTRSLPSDAFTITALAGNVLTMSGSVPEITARYTFSSATTVEVYQSRANPSPNDPLYLMSSTLVSYSPLVPATATVTVTISQDTITTNKQLYTTGNVLADDRAPGDRGVVTVGDRVWAADEHHLYPSHRVSPIIAPAWDLEQFPIEVPAQYGRIVGLGGMDDKVVAVCEQGVVIVNGAGYDDTGSGEGWSPVTRAYHVGSLGGPRSVCSFPDGVAWVGPEGLVYALSRGVQGTCIGKPMMANAETSGDITYVPPAAGIGWDSVSNPLLVHGTSNLKVLDLATGQWALWTGLTATSLCGTAAGLHALQTASPYVVAFTASGGQDLGVSFTQTIRCKPQETTQEGLMQGWGRVRSVNPVFDTLANHALRVQVFADEGRVQTMDKAAVITAGALTSKWPFSRLPEMRTTVQRAGFIEAQLDVTPAAAEWTALELWVHGAPSRAPARSRAQAFVFTGTPDATSQWNVPSAGASAASEWSSLVAGLNMAIPGSYWPLQDNIGSGGQFRDVLGTAHLTNSSIVSNVAAPSWSRVSGNVIDSGGALALNIADAILPDMSANVGPAAAASVMALWIVQVTAVTATRAIALVGPGSTELYNQVLEIDTSGHYILTDGTNSGVGTINHGSATVPIVIRYNKTLGTCDAFIDGEKISKPFQTAFSGYKGGAWIGAAYHSTATAYYLAGAAWYGANAELTDTQVLALIARIKNGH